MINDEAREFTGPHEIHVTVDPETTSPEKFVDVCGLIGVKSHIIFNEVPNGEPITDYLTGSEFDGSTAESFREVALIRAGLRASGLKVVRDKIETVPTHPTAPKTSFDRLDPESYFECHFTLPNLETLRSFRAVEWGNVPILFSTTESKRQNNQIFATMRHYIATADSFQQGVDRIYGALVEQLGEDEVKRPTVEYALFDSNPNHDKAWIDAYRK